MLKLPQDDWGQSMGLFARPKLYVFTLILGLAACAPHSSQVSTSSTGQGILGGRAVAASETIADVTVKVVIFPHNYEQTCSGTLIGETFVLTAAHCVSDSPAPKEVVLFDGTVIGIRSIKIHPQFNIKAIGDGFDFAVLELKQEVDNWAQLPTADNSLSAGDEAKIAGFGSHLPNNRGYGKLFSLPVSVDPGFSETGIKVFEGPGVGACNGDSGGPLYQVDGENVILWGVDSVEGPDSGKGSPCGTSEIYANVQPVLRWIAQSTRR